MNSMNPAPGLHATGSPGIYGRACRGCSIAKAKCLPAQEPNSKCARCRRLNKPCEPATLGQKRRDVKKMGRVAQLEQKLDGLVTLLRSTQQGMPGTGPVDLRLTQSESTSSQSSSTANSGPQLSQSNALSQLGDITESAEVPSHASGYNSRDLLAYQVPESQLSYFSELSFEEANVLIDTFRTAASSFPFIIIPSTTNAQSLRQSYPVLYRVILALACRNPNRQRQFGKELLNFVAVHMVQEGEKSLDLLLALLVHVAWYQHYMAGCPKFSTLLQQAVGLLFELGLNRPVGRHPKSFALESLSRKLAIKKNIEIFTKPRTLEERRAALGCYFLTSGIFSYWENVAPFTWTPYLEECIQKLEECGEYETDRTLIRRVRLQLISDKINLSPWYSGSDPSENIMPPVLFVKSVEIELQDFKRRYQHELELDTILLLHFHAVEMALYDIGLSKTPYLAPFGAHDLQHLDILYKCLQSVQSFFKAWFSIPAGFYCNFSLLTFAQLSRSLSMLYRLLTFEYPGWDLRYVKDTMCFSNVLEQLVVRFDNVKRFVGLVGQEQTLPRESDDIYTYTARRMSQLKAAYDNSMAAGSSGEALSETSGADITISEESIDFLGNLWLTDITGGDWW